MKKKKYLIVFGIYLVAILILIFSSFINPNEKYIAALLLFISFPFVFKRYLTNKEVKTDNNET